MGFRGNFNPFSESCRGLQSVEFPYPQFCDVYVIFAEFALLSGTIVLVEEF